MPRMIAVPGTNTVYAMLQNCIPAQGNGRARIWSRKYPGEYPNEHTDYKSSWSYRSGRWPARSGFASDPASPTNYVPGINMNSHWAGDYEPSRLGYGGNCSIKFIMGRVKDANGNAIAGAVVKGYRTSDDKLANTITADNLGNYQIGTVYPGVNHYCVAYTAGAPDRVGTTVNTLVPTNRDGT